MCFSCSKYQSLMSIDWPKSSDKDQYGQSNQDSAATTKDLGSNSSTDESILSYLTC